ncbi:hypothetical protein BDV96DRAFT_573690 [Lophiotrema nucula]|uniref:RING-type domain-containing protein n=1 Tax=Lophiotrema nucula TaxID=690887 RepID=A0A6A5ZD19_9PLEO|nr:hypothetical protein BDV96DRAFT_573690 [Lophiotrema nucula]
MTNKILLRMDIEPLYVPRDLPYCRTECALESSRSHIRTVFTEAHQTIPGANFECSMAEDRNSMVPTMTSRQQEFSDFPTNTPPPPPPLSSIVREPSFLLPTITSRPPLFPPHHLSSDAEPDPVFASPGNDNVPTRNLLLWTLRHLKPVDIAKLDHSPDTECSICHEPFRWKHPHHMPIVIKGVEGCRAHIFGDCCLIDWILSGQENATSCPVCRSKFIMSDHNNSYSDSEVESGLTEEEEATGEQETLTEAAVPEPGSASG